MEEKFTFLSTPNRQSPVAVLLILLRFFKVILRQIWPVFLILFFNPARIQDAFWTKIIIGVASLTALSSIISYFKFYFYVKEDELIIEKGILTKTKLNIPLDRIQTVNFRQNLIHRFFNVVGVELDTAGSKGNEFSITALSQEKAEAIRSFLMSQKAELVEEATIEGQVLEDEKLPTQQDKLLLHLSVTDLVKIGIGQNHLRMIGIMLAFAYGIVQMFEDVMFVNEKERDEFYTGAFEQLVSIGFDSVFFVALALFPILLIIAFILSLINTILRYYDLHFFKTTAGFKVISGLFDRQERSANMDKIQIIKWSTNPIKSYFFQLFDFRLSQAASAAISKKQSIYVPGAYQEQVDAVRADYFPDEYENPYTSHAISKLVIFRRVLFLGIYPALGMVLLRYLSIGFEALWWLLWIPIMYLLSVRFHKKWKYEVQKEGLHVSHGIFSTNHTLLKWYKIQAITIKQGIYQRRKEVANLHFYTAAGSLRIPYMELEKAKQLRDFVLYKVESSKKSWM